MIIKKLGALLLTAIIALTLVITPVISATHHNVHSTRQNTQHLQQLQKNYNHIFQ